MLYKHSYFNVVESIESFIIRIVVLIIACILFPFIGVTLLAAIYMGILIDWLAKISERKYYIQLHR